MKNTPAEIKDPPPVVKQATATNNVNRRGRRQNQNYGYIRLLKGSASVVSDKVSNVSYSSDGFNDHHINRDYFKFLDDDSEDSFDNESSDTKKSFSTFSSLFPHSLPDYPSPRDTSFELFLLNESINITLNHLLKDEVLNSNKIFLDVLLKSYKDAQAPSSDSYESGDVSSKDMLAKKSSNDVISEGGIPEDFSSSYEDSDNKYADDDSSFYSNEDLYYLN